MKIQEETVWSDVWPVVESLIQAVLAEDVEQVRPLLEPNSIADDMLDLYGYYVYDILLKSVLGRDKLAVTRAVETENGRFLHIEYAWPDVTTEDNHYTANDVVTATLTEKEDGKWLITDVNPSAIDLPLNGGRARGVIAGGQSLSEEGKVPGEAWILPYALYAGLLKMQLREEALADEVEQILLPALQDRTYGVMAQIYGRRIWRDFKQTAHPSLEKPEAWSAAIEFILAEQELRKVSQAAVAKQYKLTLSAMVPRIKQIKKALDIQKSDERYSDIQSPQIVYNPNSN